LPKQLFFNSIPDSVHGHLAAEALAGLASKEDFSSVQLRKNNTVVPHQDMVPHKTDCMLLQVRGLIKKGAGRQFLNYVENLNCFS
jgi:hypothetical protein